MKTHMQSLIGALLISSGSLFAQNASIDSPHNYKRPVFQQKQALSKSNSTSVLAKSIQISQNNLASVHNYKRQGVVDFPAQSSIVLGVLNTNMFELNPLLSVNHYKGHVQHTNINKNYWIESKNEMQALKKEENKAKSSEGIDK